MSRGERRVIVLTGATRGLGRALVQPFVELGHVVIGCGRSAPAIAELGERFRPPHDFTVLDVTQADLVQAWGERILAGQGAPDLLINNAAVINRSAPLWEVPREEFEQVIDVNIKGVANVLRAYLPAMVERRRGVIVNLSSGWGRSTAADVAPYCATKWAIEGLTQALAQELPAGMAAIPLNPGIIDTEMLRSCFGGSAAHYPSAEEWSQRAVPFLLRLGPSDNGKALTVR